MTKKAHELADVRKSYPNVLIYKAFQVIDFALAHNQFQLLIILQDTN